MLYVIIQSKMRVLNVWMRKHGIYLCIYLLSLYYLYSNVMLPCHLILLKELPLPVPILCPYLIYVFLSMPFLGSWVYVEGTIWG